MKPRRVKLNKKRNGGYAHDIKEVYTEPSEGDVPSLMPPATLRGQQQAEPNERLLERCTTPYDAHRIAGGETDDMVVGHIRRVAEERYQRIYHRCDMLCQ